MSEIIKLFLHLAGRSLSFSATELKSMSIRTDRGAGGIRGGAALDVSLSEAVV